MILMVFGVVEDKLQPLQAGESLRQATRRVRPDSGGIRVYVAEAGDEGDLGSYFPQPHPMTRVLIHGIRGHPTPTIPVLTLFFLAQGQAEFQVIAVLLPVFEHVKKIFQSVLEDFMVPLVFCYFQHKPVVRHDDLKRKVL